MCYKQTSFGNLVTVGGKYRGQAAGHGHTGNPALR
jgi:hypothetical protein